MACTAYLKKHHPTSLLFGKCTTSFYSDFKKKSNIYRLFHPNEILLHYPTLGLENYTYSTVHRLFYRGRILLSSLMVSLKRYVYFIICRHFQLESILQFSSTVPPKVSLHHPFPILFRGTITSFFRESPEKTCSGVCHIFQPMSIVLPLQLLYNDANLVFLSIVPSL
jgi:hypothetical protein